MIREKKIIKLFLLIVCSVFIAGCGDGKNSSSNSSDSKSEFNGEVIIFHAGSLSIPFKKVVEKFNESYPNITVLLESSGSVACARKITDLEKPCDIIASADYKIIDNMLIPDHASWNIIFAGNEMVIAFNEKSNYREEIDENNYFDVLLKEDVELGRADPNSDPCGYRSILMMQLTEQHYGISKFANVLINRSKFNVRPKSVDLIALLEANALDYILVYRSVAEQHNLNYIVLPDEINMGNINYSEKYALASTRINGKKPGDKVLITGEPMIYGMSILNNAPNRENALLFAELLLSVDNGLAILGKNGQPTFQPYLFNGYDLIPERLKKVVSDQ